MADKMAAVQGYGCISSVYISFQVLLHVVFRRVPASTLGFHVDNMSAVVILMKNLCTVKNYVSPTKTVWSGELDVFEMTICKMSNSRGSNDEWLNVGARVSRARSNERTREQARKNRETSKQTNSRMISVWHKKCTTWRLRCLHVDSCVATVADTK